MRAVKDVLQLDAYVMDKVGDSLIGNDWDVLVLFLRDALLLLAVSELVGAIHVEKRNQVLAHVGSLTRCFISFNRHHILHRYSFVNFSDSVETVKPLPIEYYPQSSIMGRINADRFVHFMETHRKGLYHLSKVCSFLESYQVSQEYSLVMRFLELKDDGLNLYTRNRVQESSLLYHLTEARRLTGYIFNPTSFSLTTPLGTLFSLEQSAFQLIHLLPTTNVVVGEVDVNKPSSSMIEEYAKLESSELAEYVRAWLHIWKHAFCHGLTEVLDYQFTPNEPSIIRDKLRVLRLYFRNNKRLNDVLQLEQMFEALMARSELLIAHI